MKITALTNNNTINQQLANYALSLFEQTKIEVIDVTAYEIEAISTKIKDANLVVVVLDEKDSWFKISDNKILEGKPILLLSVYKNEVENTQLVTNITELFQNSGNTIWGIFSLPNTTDAFNQALEITNIGLRLILIRMINSIMFHQLRIRNNNKFSCGITPPKHYVGDSIGY